jgi:hypothetical protein
MVPCRAPPPERSRVRPGSPAPVPRRARGTEPGRVPSRPASSASTARAVVHGPGAHRCATRDRGRRYRVGSQPRQRARDRDPGIPPGQIAAACSRAVVRVERAGYRARQEKTPGRETPAAGMEPEAPDCRGDPRARPGPRGHARRPRGRRRGACRAGRDGDGRASPDGNRRTPSCQVTGPAAARPGSAWPIPA